MIYIIFCFQEAQSLGFAYETCGELRFNTDPRFGRRFKMLSDAQNFAQKIEDSEDCFCSIMAFVE